MKRFFLLASLFPFTLLAQDDSSIVEQPAAKQPDRSPAWIFAAPKIINTQSVEMIPKRTLAFNVTHNFGDIGGDNGGGKTFFGLDNATDVKIGFVYGLSNKVNIGLARAKGASLVQQQLEFSLKYQLMSQSMDNHFPVSITLYGNSVVSATKRSPFPDQDNSFESFGSRFSHFFQVMFARRFGKLSLQLSPSVVTRSYVTSGDQSGVFALGGAVRLPIRRNFGLIMDYVHPFHSAGTKAFYRSQQLELYDVFGIGAEFITGGHVFHLNFTNATEILENRMIPRTVTSWGKGQFRWGFTITRDFYFKKKKVS